MTFFRYLNAVALVLLIFGGCMLLCVPFQTIWDDGMRECTFHFFVVDAKTKRPLQGVSIALYDEAPRTLQEIKTDVNGETVVDLPCMITCKVRSSILFSHSRRSIYYPNRIVIISMGGYKQHEFVNLTDLVGTGHVGDYRPPAPVQIELEPK